MSVEITWRCDRCGNVVVRAAEVSYQDLDVEMPWNWQTRESVDYEGQEIVEDCCEVCVDDEDEVRGAR